MKRITAVALLLLASLAAVAQTSGSANAQGLMTASGSACLVTSTNCVLLPLPSGAASANVVLSGTFSATVQFELSADGVTFVAANALPQPSGTAVSSATATGTWAIPLAGMTFLRARCSAFTSGTIGAYLQSSQAGAATVSLPVWESKVRSLGAYELFPQQDSLLLHFAVSVIHGLKLAVSEPSISKGRNESRSSGEKCSPSSFTYRIVEIVLLLAFGVSLSFLIFFKLDLERDWQLVALLLLSFVSCVYGGISLAKFITECV